ncbi:MAG: hypothetical protein M1836_004799 [Candelina mexicana]|nr:MAG: hypothetical protein M1836_004799 [Candelina mexicana]
MSDKLMDTVPGGESDQYESQKTLSNPTPKQGGQMGGEPSTQDPAPLSQPPSAERTQSRGEKTAENIRYGEALSEHGYGGETLGNDGVKGVEGGFGGVREKNVEESAEKTRKEQGYGQGSGVGA